MDITLIRDGLMLLGITVVMLSLLLLAIWRLFGRGLLLKLMFWNSLLIFTGGTDAFLIERLGLSPLTLGVGAVLGILSTLVVTTVIFRQVIQPVQTLLAVAQHIAKGDVSEDVQYHSQDEIGQLAAAFRQAVIYQQEMAEAAGQMAAGDLSASVSPTSQRDLLGNAFAQMLTNLRTLIAQVQENAYDVAAAGDQINAAETRNDE